MPISDPSEFVLGSGGAGWGRPSSGWWNNQQSSTVIPQHTASGASGLSPAAGMDLTSLTNYINALNRTGQTEALRARIPQNLALETQSSRNIGSELRGQLPGDVVRQIQQQAAERGVSSGVAGSDNESAAYLRALGLTSLNLQEQGQRDLSAADARNPAAPLYDPATQLMTPYQSSQLGLEQERLNLEAMDIAARRAGAGSGGARYAGGYNLSAPAELSSGPEVVAPSLAGGSTDPAALGTGGFGQREWYASIGYAPGGSDPSNPPEGTVTAGGASSSPIDWSSLFANNLGIDNSLYQQN